MDMLTRLILAIGLVVQNIAWGAGLLMLLWVLSHL